MCADKIMHHKNVIITGPGTSTEPLTPTDEDSAIKKAYIRAGEALGLNDHELSAILDDSIFTLMLIRQENERLQLDSGPKSRALLLIQLHQSLLAVTGNEGNACSWLNSQNNALCGRPRELITSHAGLEQVVRYLVANQSIS